MQPFPGEITRQYVTREHETITGKTGHWRFLTFVLTQEQEAWLRKWYPIRENSLLMSSSGMSHSTLHRLARQLGLKKSKRGLEGIKKRQAAHIKEVCEANGWYDSLRGRPVSEECRQGTARMWQEIREGKRLHPFRILLRDDPKRYSDMVRTNSARRKTLIARERMRQDYGVARHTRLHLPAAPYTRKQVSHRYNAMRRGYYVMEDKTDKGGYRFNIYYDQDTTRSELFERNLRADGFRVLPG